jgi:cytochrome c peroxidase
MKLIILTIFFRLLFAQELISPLPLSVEYDINKAMLGKKLFFDTRLSGDNTIACVSCHIIDAGGDDNVQFSSGIDGQLGGANSPTVLNSRYNFVQFWDGSAKDLKEQASGPIHNPVEMGSNFKQVISKLSKDTIYQQEFMKLYKDGITGENITDAIAEFEKALVTPNSRFDQYLRGNTTILSKDEVEGFELFKSLGCIACHNGINIGGNLFQKIGIMEEYEVDDSNLGRYNVTKDEEDKHYFKVPTLRNIALTAPYLHDGKISTLQETIKLMIIKQLGKEADKQEVIKIEKFLFTLTGQTPKIMSRQ